MNDFYMIVNCGMGKIRFSGLSAFKYFFINIIIIILNIIIIIIIFIFVIVISKVVKMLGSAPACLFKTHPVSA